MELGASTQPRTGRLREFAGALSKDDRRSLAGMTCVIVALHVVGFGLLIAMAPRHDSMSGHQGVLGLGVGLLAYTFGLRHAFDADHIGAIDNATRKLVADRSRDVALGKRADRQPLSVGFWFSLGHSSVVFVLAFVLTLGVKTVSHSVVDGRSRLHSIAAVVGASVSGTFLWVLGIANLVVLVGIVRIVRRAHNGHVDEVKLNAQLEKRGVMSRLLNGLVRCVRKPWHTYPVGALFGLGFDTATEVGLLVLAGGAAASAVPSPWVLVLPVLFAAGMCLMDSVDGVFMNAAYSWSRARPVRKIFYDITVTAISVAVALIIGTVELVGAFAELAHQRSGPLRWVADLNVSYAGYTIAALFAVVWIVAFGVWRKGRFDERWADDVSLSAELG